MESKIEPLITDFQASDEPEAMEISSYCFNCRKTGVTRMMLTRIAYFREVIISSFSCPHCGNENRTVDPAAPNQDYGKLFKLDVRCAKDLNRRIIQPSNSVIRIPSLDSSFPTSQGCLTTVEGAIVNIIDNLSALQPQRKEFDPAQAEKIEEFIVKLRHLLNVESPFILELEDPTGNGFIESLRAPLADPQISFSSFKRTAEQADSLGLVFPDTDEVELADDDDPNLNPASKLKDSVSVFHVECPNCHSNCQTNMKIVDIPNFQEVILMAVNCDLCGYRDNEVKSVSGIADKGKKYSLLITNPADLSRDVLNGDSAVISFPELDIESQSGTLGGRFTTVEGLMILIRDQLKSLNPFLFGDSSDYAEKSKGLKVACDALEEVISGQRVNVHLELSDATGNSYLQSLQDDGPDSNLVITEFERTDEQNEELGLNDMHTENY